MEQTGLEKMRLAMKEISKNSPLLVMGTAVQDFRKHYSGPIRSVKTTDEVRELVAYYTSISSLDVPLVIEDLSFLSENAMFMLLKLVEESKFDIVLLSTFDKVSSIMLSRVKTLVKYQKETTTSEFGSMGPGYKRIQESLSPDSHIFDRYRYISKISPVVYYYEKRLKSIRNKAKIMELLS